MTAIDSELVQLRSELFYLRSAFEAERQRLDNALCLQEGLYEERERLFNLRKSTDFQEIFHRTEPLVSVCIATHNRADVLAGRALRSVLDQTYRNLQIIVVGDACTDNTEKLLSDQKDARIVFENLPVCGPYPPPGRARWCVAGSNAMNRALDLAEGDFITHLDDDDEYHPSRIAVLLAAAQEAKAEFLWHQFSAELPDGIWETLGKNKIALGQISTGSIFYHRYFSRIKWDTRAYLLDEPGDWNRIKKIRFLNPVTKFVNQVLMLHHIEGNQPQMELQEVAYLP